MQDDARLREIIGEYEVARSALAYWRTVDAPGTRRLGDYESIVQDLENEIEANLEPSMPDVSRSSPSRPLSTIARGPQFTPLETKEQFP